MARRLQLHLQFLWEAAKGIYVLRIYNTHICLHMVHGLAAIILCFFYCTTIEPLLLSIMAIPPYTYIQKDSSDAEQHLYHKTMSEVERFLFDLFFLGYVEDTSSGLSFIMPSELSWACYCEVRKHACKFWCRFIAMQLADRNVHGNALYRSPYCWVLFCVWHMYRSPQEKRTIQMCHVGILLRNYPYWNL